MGICSIYNDSFHYFLIVYLGTSFFGLLWSWWKKLLETPVENVLCYFNEKWIIRETCIAKELKSHENWPVSPKFDLKVPYNKDFKKPILSYLRCFARFSTICTI